MEDIHKKADTDGDGLTDALEVALGTPPTSADTDGDGLTNLEESVVGTDPHSADTDGDGVNDGTETAQGSDPASASVTVRVRPRQEPGPFNVSVYVVTFSRDPASRVLKLTVSGRAVPRNRNRLAREAERWQNSLRQVNSATQSAR